MDLPETSLWWTTHQQQNTSDQPTTWFNSHHTHGDQPLHYNNNNFILNNQNDNVEEDEEEQENDNDDENNNTNSATTTAHLEDEKEPMFEKPLTPSDVGKLNRLVIPKQHAEKYFPLGGHGVSGECKGLLLSFEDESGKCWRFRYSYWNSSQSYVLTKGWSRYVKDKRLDAGDIVLFERHRVESQRLFINWRRRRTSGTDPAAHVSRDVKSGYSKNEVGGGGGSVGVGWTRGGFYSAHPSYPAHHQFFPYQQDSLHAGRGSQPEEGERQRTKAVGKSCSSSNSSSSRVLRLFGVNMECQSQNDDSGPSTPQGSSYDSNNMPSTQAQGVTETHHLYHYHQPSSNPQPHLLRHQPYYY